MWEAIACETDIETPKRGNDAGPVGTIIALLHSNAVAQVGFPVEGTLLELAALDGGCDGCAAEPSAVRYHSSDACRCPKAWVAGRVARGEVSFRIACEGRSRSPRPQLRGKPLSTLRVKKPTAKPEISDQIGRQLRSVYNDLLAQPVPDRFLDLLKDLDNLAPATPARVAQTKVAE